MKFLPTLTFLLASIVALAQAPPNAIASFTGSFRSADRKYVHVDVDNGETLRFIIAGSTKFIRDGKPAKPSDFRAGDKVAVDAELDLLRNMLAVRVEKVTVPANAAGPPKQ